MGLDDEILETAELRSEILRTTLSEISSRPVTRGDGSGGVAATGEGDMVDATADHCCVICLDVVSNGCEATPCGHHNYDFACLMGWLAHNSSCPLCKADIKEVHHEFADGGRTWQTWPVPPPSPPPARNEGSARAALEPEHAFSRSRWSRPRRRRPSPPPGPSPPSMADELARRRRVYQRKLYSLHVGTNRITRYTDLTPQMFKDDPTLVSRARLWLRRELQVFDFLCVAGLGVETSASSSSSSVSNSVVGPTAARRRLTGNAEFLLEYIVAILKSIDLRGSRGQAEEMLQEFLGRDNTRLFLHELRAWLRSPYMSLQAWDAHVQYDDNELANRHRTGNGGVGGAHVDATTGRLDRYQQHGGSLARRRGDHWRPAQDRYSPYGPCGTLPRRGGHRHARGESIS